MSLIRTLLQKTLKTSNLSSFLRISCSNVQYSTRKLQNVVAIDKPAEVQELDKPIEYSKSKASQWQAKSSLMGTDVERLWYEPIVVLVSIAVFMLYFCVLREENDIDKEFDKTLYSRIQGLEERQLILSLKYNCDHGLETKAIEDELRKIAEARK